MCFAAPPLRCAFPLCKRLSRFISEIPDFPFPDRYGTMTDSDKKKIVVYGRPFGCIMFGVERAAVRLIRNLKWREQEVEYGRNTYTNGLWQAG